MGGRECVGETRTALSLSLLVGVVYVALRVYVVVGALSLARLLAALFCSS